MDEASVPADKAVIITRIEYLILNLYSDPDNILRAICHLIDEHQIAAMHDIMTYFYEMLFYRGYEEHARTFAEIYSVPTVDN
jgi:hypothetical protein